MNTLLVTLLALTGMTWTAGERVRVDPDATLRFTAHAGTTYRITATTRCSCYAIQPRIVVPSVAVVDDSGARVVANRLVKQIDDAKFALQTEITFTAPADGAYSVVIAADQSRAGQVIGAFAEESMQVGIGSSNQGVITSSAQKYAVPVKGATSGVVDVKIVEE